VIVKKSLPLLALVTLILLSGCQSDQTASPTPTSLPLPTPTPAGPAACYLSPFNFQEIDAPEISESDHVHGSADADIVIIEYADFQCPGCAAMVMLRDYLEDAHGDNIVFAFRHFLLSYHELAEPTAEAAEAAGAQGAFWEMHDLLYERRDEWIELTPDEIGEQLVAYAEELGLDTEEFAADMENDVYLEHINADNEFASAAGLPGTPTYIINGVLYPSSDLGLHPILVSGFPRIVGIETYGALPPQVLLEGRDYSATISTNKGDIVIELFSEQAPTNANCFAFLASDGWYDGQAFFSVDYEIAAQAGDPAEVGWGLPLAGFYCGDEIRADLTFDEAGMVALVRSQEDVNVAQFFITYTPLPRLNGQFTIIGRVTEGMDVLESLTATSPDLGQPEPDVIERITIEEQ
jgi:cyclophilin family peptidyl-prolyl cis-trans isomerase